MFKPGLSRALAGLFLIVTTAACTKTTHIGAVAVEPDYAPSVLADASEPDGEMQVVVYGNPFYPGMPDPVFSETMAQAMRGSHFGPPVDFTTKPASRNRNGYRVVLQFTGGPALSGRHLCRAAAGQEEPPSTESSGSIPVRMAFCQGPKLLTEVLAHFGGAGGITVEDSEKLVSRMTLTLLPPTNPVAVKNLESDFKQF